MLLSEIVTEQPLLEGQLLTVYNELLPLLLISEDGEGGGEGGGEMGSETTSDVAPPAEVVPPPQPGRGSGIVGLYGNPWFNQLFVSLKNLAVATNISKRLKVLGIGGEGARRVKLAAQTAAKNVKVLLNNPGATSYRIPVWTTQKPPKPVIRMWNEAFSREFAKELSHMKINELL